MPSPSKFSTLQPSINDLWFLPLGGTGEIGMNLNLYGHNGQWLMVDCGLTFNAPLNAELDDDLRAKRHNLVAADPSFISERREALAGIVITHAHEDHLGAIPYLWDKFACPIYTTRFTAEVLRRKLYAMDVSLIPPIIEVSSDEVLNIGVFSVEWMQITHSLPDAHAIYINTPAGSIFHTADWKIDYHPVVGNALDADWYRALSKRDTKAIVCDSTNARREGKTVSESACYVGLKALIQETDKRVLVTCFASNVGRLLTLARIAQETGRYMTVLGRSLENMISIAKATGYWPDEYKIANKRHIGYLPKHEVLIVATGSQGEARAALSKLAQEQHPYCELDAQDRVIFSAITIPGNERPIQRLVNAFRSRDVEVFQEHDVDLPIHASGHPSQTDLKTMFKWVQPDILIPVHGEAADLQQCAELGLETGIERAYAGKNGDLFQLAPIASVKRGAVRTARIEVGDMQNK